MTESRRKREDREAFEREMAGVKRLAPGKSKALAPKPSSAARRLARSSAPPVAFIRDGEGDGAGFRATDVGPDILRKLRRGELAMERELDLHGLTADEARRDVARAVRAGVASGLRGLRVVHGKGRHSVGPGVLRDAMQEVLLRSPLARHVAAVAPAPPRAGGAGASHVLLRGQPRGRRS